MTEARVGLEGANKTVGKKLYMTDDLTPLTEAIANIDGPLLFFNVGIACSGGDSFGPILGTLLEEARVSQYDVAVIGTERENIGSLNIPFMVVYAHLHYSHHTLIATDAACGPVVGRYLFERGALRPGACVEYELPTVGDYFLMVSTFVCEEGEDPKVTAKRCADSDMRETRRYAQRACDAIVAGLKLRQSRQRQAEVS